MTRWIELDGRTIDADAIVAYERRGRPRLYDSNYGEIRLHLVGGETIAIALRPKEPRTTSVSWPEPPEPLRRFVGRARRAEHRHSYEDYMRARDKVELGHCEAREADADAIYEAIVRSIRNARP